MDEGRRGEGVNQQQQEDPSNNQRRLKPQKTSRFSHRNAPDATPSTPMFATTTTTASPSHATSARHAADTGPTAEPSGTSPSQPPQTTEPPSISVVPPASTYFSGGGFLSSLAAVQSLSHHQQQQPPFSLGQFGPGSGSNLGLLQGLNVFGVGSSHGPQIQQQQSDQVYQMGNRVKNEETLYSSGQTLVDQTSRPSGYWSQTLVSNSGTNTTGSNPSRFWSGTTNSSTTGINPNQWPDLPGYGHTP
ncbi:unnamed protein product [Thlaspi arvense]|uniref:Uncharacterized protein n=1 Tax=Thlaspi arvense TaxID=13288 RepID=A0AAU9TAN0_THLAR|nr:unnamed protein product [Thlaspi arvense]